MWNRISFMMMIVFCIPLLDFRICRQSDPRRLDPLVETEPSQIKSAFARYEGRSRVSAGWAAHLRASVRLGNWRGSWSSELFSGKLICFRSLV
jgi:hypothetical protein